MKVYLCLFSLLFFFSCDTVNSLLEPSGEYPTVIPVLSDSELNKLQNEFYEINNYKIEAQLNKYGFIGYDHIYHCPFEPDIKLSSSDIKKIVLNTLIKNRKFTNTKSIITLLSSNIQIRDLYNEIYWRLDIGPQIHNNLEVLHSNIMVKVWGDNVYCIYDSWYPDAFVPYIDNISPDEAKTKSLGYEIEMIGYYPRNSKLTVDENSFGEITRKVIVPFEKENSMELRVTWQIPIKYQEDFVGWYLYLDTTTGEIVKEEQVVIFN